MPEVRDPRTRCIAVALERTAHARDLTLDGRAAAVEHTWVEVPLERDARTDKRACVLRLDRPVEPERIVACAGTCGDRCGGVCALGEEREWYGG